MSFLKLVFALFLLGGCAIPPDANAPPDAFRSGFIDKSNVLTAELAAKALIAYNGGRYEEADLLLEEAESHLAKGAFSIPLAHNRAIILSRLKNFEKSAEIYEELIRRVPDSAALWFERGNLFSSWLKYEEAIAAYNQATSLALKERDYVLLKNIAQSESALHYLFGGINLSLIRSAESVGYVGINDELAATHGRLLLASGKFLSAKKFLTKFYPPPNFGTKGEVTYLLALSEIGLGHLSEADELTKKAIQFSYPDLLQVEKLKFIRFLLGFNSSPESDGAMIEESKELWVNDLSKAMDVSYLPPLLIRALDDFNDAYRKDF